MAATGLIPAHAGKTLSTVAEMPSKRAHPRSRGENRRPRPLGRRRPGSSPLTRGKLACLDAGHDRSRLIPAHAGKTRRCFSRPSRTRAHPRSRGENDTADFTPLMNAGSSPLTRGKLVQSGHERGRDGLIPAHAGKTADSGRSRPAYGAHPRSRGENPVRRALEEGCQGSSPLTRGKPA